jgi:hypothetical protein
VLALLELLKHSTKARTVAMIVMPSPITAVYRSTIISPAAERHIPTVYPYRYFVADGGLMSYGVDVRDQFRQAAFYISRARSEATAVFGDQHLDQQIAGELRERYDLTE